MVADDSGVNNPGNKPGNKPHLKCQALQITLVGHF